MNNIDYEAAYKRQKAAREQAEKLLEDKARELYDANQSLVGAYNRLKDSKAQLLHHEKLASIGQLAAGIAHEINNPTGFVKSNLGSLSDYLTNLSGVIDDYEARLKNKTPTDTQDIESLRKKWDIDYILEDVVELTDESIEGLVRIEAIVANLKNFARPDQDENEPFSLNECIETTLKLVNSEVKHKADISVKLNDIPPVNGKPGAISQVVLNLIVNAADAIETHGKIRIATSVEDNNIRLDISDTGCGIPQNAINRIYDPFYTSKEIGHGTGLGLSISHGIIKKHGGRMAVDSEEGKGTEFSIFLPITND